MSGKPHAIAAAIWGSRMFFPGVQPRLSQHVYEILKTSLQTRNTFCGTWYLHHSHVHNERTVLL